MTLQAAMIRFTGVVQGVGFRPFVYRIALEMKIAGWVINTSEGVTIHAEGSNSLDFYHRLVAELPPLARVYEQSYTTVEHQGYQGFEIRQSRGSSEREVLIAPDVATCSVCQTEIFSSTERRHNYPFTNCTNCGPRYTIIFDVPYDRPNTTMNKFPMCPKCKAEYNDPLDRRFHAQPIACPVCGPGIVLQDSAGNQLDGFGLEQLKAGRILAIKGLGGFHLACNALDENVVSILRNRKQRESKPFAVMAKDIAVIRKYCEVSELEEKLLTSPAAPIVILKTKGTLQELGLPQSLAPKLTTLGVMLPYTPLHHLLLGEDLDLLVMTSANVSGHPLIFHNEEAITKLIGICDYWVLHNREIYHPCDDSVVKVINNSPVFFRRARGYVPLPVDLGKECLPVLGIGGDIKNTFCLLKHKQAFVSQHGGDLSNYDNYQQFIWAVDSFQRVIATTPMVVGYDLHPEYHSSKYAKGREDLQIVGVQHHHAHLVACLAENKVEHKVLGVICDGTGYGLDGAIWGFEFLWGDKQEFRRVGHLEYLPLPGGDAASKRPERIALAYLIHLLGYQDSFQTNLPGLSQEEVKIIKHQVQKGLNTFQTSSCGRLFDAVAALTGICTEVNYEGQAAIELEAVIKREFTGCYPFELECIGPELILRVKSLFAAIIEDLAHGTCVEDIAIKFHNTVGEMILAAIVHLGRELSTNQTLISGGVFQNKYLAEYLVPRLENAGFTVYQHKELSPGDGGLCLGQAVVASEVMNNVYSDSR
jgi:hydrogenase maturation protein HypF